MSEEMSKQKYFREREQLEYPVRRSEGIEAGKIYRTRSGLRAQVYNVTEQEVHGAILMDGVWEMYSWRKDGFIKGSKGKDHPNDLVMSKPLKIEAGGIYKSRDDRMIRVWEVNKDSVDFPIIGAIRDDRDKSWLPRVWNGKGITKTPFGPNNDIVAEWGKK